MNKARTIVVAMVMLTEILVKYLRQFLGLGLNATGC